jgi:hypothetical protein
MQDAKNEIDEMRYLVMGLDSYNYYLRRQMKLEIKDIKHVYSKIAAAQAKEKNMFVGDLALFFVSDKRVEADTLYPLRKISELLNKPETELLVGEALKNRVKELGAAAAAIIPLTIQIITLRWILG